jgi:hypothetical protein
MPARLRSDRPIEKNQGPLIDLFGDTARTRIWNFLTLYAASSEYSKSEIARNSYVSWRSFNRVWPEIVKSGLLMERRAGQSRLYRLDMNKVASQLIVRMADETAFATAVASLPTAQREPLMPELTRPVATIPITKASMEPAFGTFPEIKSPVSLFFQTKLKDTVHELFGKMLGDLTMLPSSKEERERLTDSFAELVTTRELALFDELRREARKPAD